MANDVGRPEYTEETYEAWLKEMKPFLERGKSLYKSMELSGLEHHKDIIYRKYRLNDWFREKVDMYGRELGEVINDTVVSLIYDIRDKVKLGEVLADNELKALLFAAEKHRSAQPFFVNRFETAKGKPVEEIIEDLEKQNDNIDDVVENIEGLEIANEQQLSATTSEQVVASEPPIQDQGQEGTDNNVSPQPDPNQVS